jgi:hypothetical protein
VVWLKDSEAPNRDPRLDIVEAVVQAGGVWYAILDSEMPSLDLDD